jgi:aryl-alcohol dehydrogenase-like predicted oxidoreductase
VKYVNLGDRQASAIGLGLWQFGSDEWAWGRDLSEPAAKLIVQRALDLGINLFDTAELYGDGRSEEILARSLGDRRNDAIIATKVTPTHATHDGVVNAANGSLSRLGVEAIDLYQVHWPNRLIPIQRTMEGMRELVETGKVREVGVSNFPLRLWRKAEGALGRPVVSNQVQFHLLDRTPMDDLLPYARREGRVIIAYSPLAQGVLGGRYERGKVPEDFRVNNPLFSRTSFERITPLLEELRLVARAHEATMAQIALAWLLHLPQVIAIPGARSLEQVQANAAAADIELSGEQFQRLTWVAKSVQPRPLRRKIRRLLGLLLGAR